MKKILFPTFLVFAALSFCLAQNFQVPAQPVVPVNPVAPKMPPALPRPPAAVPNVPNAQVTPQPSEIPHQHDPHRDSTPIPSPTVNR
jgi:hypothetical protein